MLFIKSAASTDVCIIKRMQGDFKQERTDDTKILSHKHNLVFEDN